MPVDNENHRNLSHHGLKEASGFVTRIDSSAPNEMPRGGVCGSSPLNPDPHGRGPKANPYTSPSSRAPRGDPQQMRPPHAAAPHRYGADPGPRESVVITPRSKP
jgi:hypothetical protein